MLLSGAAANTGSAAVAAAALQYMAVAASLAGSGILAVNLGQYGHIPTVYLASLPSPYEEPLK